MLIGMSETTIRYDIFCPRLIARGFIEFDFVRPQLFFVGFSAESVLHVSICYYSSFHLICLVFRTTAYELALRPLNYNNHSQLNILSKK